MPIEAAIASRTASTPWPASAGPFLIRGYLPCPSIRARCSSMVEPGGAFDQGPGRRAVQAEDEVAFPVPGNGTVLGLGRPFPDHDLGSDELLAVSSGPGPGHPKRPPGAQACGQLAAQRAAALHVQRLVDGLVQDPHGLIIGEVGPEPVGDLLQGLLKLAHRRSRRRPWRRPTHRTSGPRTAAPSGVAIVPARPSCTYVRSASFAASFAALGRLARRWAPMTMSTPSSSTGMEAQPGRWHLTAGDARW